MPIYNSYGSSSVFLYLLRWIPAKQDWEQEIIFHHFWRGTFCAFIVALGPEECSVPAAVLGPEELALPAIFLGLEEFCASANY